MAGGKHTTGTCGRGLRNDANGVVAPLTLGECVVVNVTQSSRLWIVYIVNVGKCIIIIPSRR